MYEGFAEIYDRLMYDVDYSSWADYLESIFHAYGCKPSLVLDLGCGTGKLCMEMAGRDYEMIGVDISVDMLSRAREEAEKRKLDILFLNQDMTDFELYGTVDAVFCMMDSINYVTRKKDLLRMFKLVKNYLNPQGIFIFDINTPYKLKNILGNNVFYEIDNDVAYIWQNSYNNRSRLCRFELTFFVRDENEDTYRRFDEVHYEKAYGIDELEDLIRQAGLEPVAVYDNLSFNAPNEKSERVFFVCINKDAKKPSLTGE